MVEIEIDGKKVEVQEGSMIMDAANKVGTYIPHFCYHKKLSIAANCRMCLVDVEKAPKPLPACATPVANGMVVRSHSDKAVQAQKGVMEFLLINHPLDCPICDQGGECQLQDLAVGYGASASRYQEEKRVVVPKEIGPLVSAQEMARCIQCTRCVRFGQEVAGVMELGMLNRGEHAEIAAFVGKSVDSELSGNMIDLCPVGALTSKPFRYRARTWELSRRKSVSPHDSLGSNLIVQVKNGEVLRVLPYDNEEINECWLSDRDRFAYEGLNTPDRLTTPMIKQGGEWRTTDWQTALEYVAHGLRNIRHEHGADAVAALAAPNATLEELFLLQKTMRGLGTENIDFRLRQSDARLDGKLLPWLGMPLARFSSLKYLFTVGTYLRRDHPLLAARIRVATRGGLKLGVMHAVEDDWLMPISERMTLAPSAWLDGLYQVAAAVAQAKQIAVPDAFAGAEPSPAAHAIAAGLLAGEDAALMLGNAVAQHPDASLLHVAAEWIARATGVNFGYLTEAANSVGGYLVNAYPGNGANALSLLREPRKAYLLWNMEPEFDCHDPQAAQAALTQAAMVVQVSAYQTGMDYADVLLPLAPFSETSGTWVNAEGRVQSVNASVKAKGEARPGWKILRVLGNLLELEGFDYDSPEQVREAALAHIDPAALLNNWSGEAPQANPERRLQAQAGQVERLAHVPIYAVDPIVRRSQPLQQTRDAAAPKAWLSPQLAQRLGVENGQMVRIRQGTGEALLPAIINAGLPDNMARVSAAHPHTSALAGMFGAIVVEKA